jgi:hypothetical protein
MCLARYSTWLVALVLVDVLGSLLCLARCSCTCWCAWLVTLAWLVALALVAWLVTLAWLVALALVDVLGSLLLLASLLLQLLIFVISQHSWCLWRSPVHLDLILTIPTPSPLLPWIGISGRSGQTVTASLSAFVLGSWGPETCQRRRLQMSEASLADVRGVACRCQRRRLQMSEASLADVRGVALRCMRERDTHTRHWYQDFPCTRMHTLSFSHYHAHSHTTQTPKENTSVCVCVLFIKQIRYNTQTQVS